MMRSMKPILRIAAACSMVLSLSACASEPGAASVDKSPATTSRPNVLWVIWDTVRADRLGVYGHDKPTTPKLDRWAKGARVFEHCASTAGQTLPSTATMFTGLFPAEHGTNPKWTRLEDRFPTIAELFRDSGYRTYLYSANAYLSKEHNFHRGFEGEEHPWDEPFIEEATRIVREKLEPANHAGRLYRVAAGEPRKGDLKSAGALAQVGLTDWLEATDDSKPFFTVLNYMEAHLPRLPSRKYRERMLPPERVDESYKLHVQPWEYSFGLFEHDESELELIRAVYDASIAELDDRFAELLESLASSGRLENTIVVLTSDHGDHLGDHHMLEHQFSLYEGLIHVPLIVHYPKRFEPGRESRPVSGIDLFPTLLDLAGIEQPEGTLDGGVHLLTPDVDRVRLAEYPVVHGSIDKYATRNPDWDSSPFRRLLRAIYHDGDKLIVANDSHRELYRFLDDPGELENRVETDSEMRERMAERMREFVGALDNWEPEGTEPELSSEQFERLKALGYVGFE
jgi:arylsulfatase A-like enzyme